MLSVSVCSGWCGCLWFGRLVCIHRLVEDGASRKLDSRFGLVLMDVVFVGFLGSRRRIGRVDATRSEVDRERW